MPSTRRQMLGALAATSATAFFDPGPLLARALAIQACTPDTWGPLLGTLPLSRPDAQVQPFGVRLGGRGLDARLVTDLSTLDRDRLITPTARAFIRTESPVAVTRQKGWSVKVSGLAGDSHSLTLSDLTRQVRPMGAHLLECSGNNNPANFGLMSVCEWDGVLLSDVLSRLRRAASATSVVVSGIDPEGERSVDSIAGASWVFPLASIDRLGAFLAVRMNGEPLPPDHGSPVRLVVPGWYGCTWIKWVNDIRVAATDEPATGQMKEFAGRTHQTARHDLARDYTPADVQVAAMPIRVEKRRAQRGVEYRVVGIVWGGETPVNRLAIRFRAKEPWTRFAVCPTPITSGTWSLWEYRWKPSAPGVYDISLSVPDRSVPQRRLDAGYYMRQVMIEEV
ncbi:MAG TPA: molybdopterin-dependent oxidoreductase [Vicinamibacterales bacterium]|nr:molybdopterin-dependent oxidoreductase [Vicinamibacterales bacterium]